MAKTTMPPRDATFLEWRDIRFGHQQRILCRDIEDQRLATCLAGLAHLEQGHRYAIHDGQYVVEKIRGNSKTLHCRISRLYGDASLIPITHFVICFHSRYRHKVWRDVGGGGEAPQVPFVATFWDPDTILTDDINHLPILQNFAYTMAWAYLEKQSTRKIQPQDRPH